MRAWILLLFLIPVSCEAFGRGPEEDSKEPELDGRRYLEQDTPIDTDLGARQKFLLTEFVEMKEKNQDLLRDLEKLRLSLEESDRKWRQAEAERLQERNGKITAQAQVGAKDGELRQALARILDLQIQRSRLQQKVYLLQLAAREKQVSDQLRGSTEGIPTGAQR